MRPLGVPRWVPHNTALRPPRRRALRAGPPLRSPPGSPPLSPPLPWRPSGGFLFWPPLAKSRPLQYDRGCTRYRASSPGPPGKPLLALPPRAGLTPGVELRHALCARLGWRVSTRRPWVSSLRLPPVAGPLALALATRRPAYGPGAGLGLILAIPRERGLSCSSARYVHRSAVLALPSLRLRFPACTDLDSFLVFTLVAWLAAWRCPAAAGRTEQPALGPWSPPAGPGRLPRAAGLVAPRPLPGRAAACFSYLCKLVRF